MGMRREGELVGWDWWYSSLPERKLQNIKNSCSQHYLEHHRMLNDAGSMLYLVSMQYFLQVGCTMSSDNQAITYCIVAYTANVARKYIRHVIFPHITWYAVRSILIGERFFQNFQSLETIGNMYQYTEAFCHYSWNSPEQKISSSLTFQYLERKQENMEDWKIARNKCRKLGEKLSDKNDPKKGCRSDAAAAGAAIRPLVAIYNTIMSSHVAVTITPNPSGCWPFIGFHPETDRARSRVRLF